MKNILTEKMLSGRSVPHPAFHLTMEESASPLVDKIHGVSVAISGTFTVDGNGIILAETTGNNVTGPLVPIRSTESALLIVSRKLGNSPLGNNSADYYYGDGTSGLWLQRSAGSARSTAENSSKSFPAIPDDDTNDTSTAALCVDRAAGVLRVYSEVNGGTVAEASTTNDLGDWDGTEIAALNDMLFGMATGAAPATYYGVALYKWTGAVPGDILDCIQHAADNWINGIKTLYSGWS